VRPQAAAGVVRTEGKNRASRVITPDDATPVTRRGPFCDP
jgi:hypothetical protein